MIDYKRIKTTYIEDFIFIIYYLIITLSLYANHIERNYFLTKNQKLKNKYRLLLYIIFTTAFLIYLYYTISDYKELKEEKNTLKKLSFLASILVLISGAIYLYIVHKDEDISIELVFN